MHYGTFHRGMPRVDATAPPSGSDSDIYISANDVSVAHFHFYAYKYARAARPGHVNGGASGRRKINPPRSGGPRGLWRAVV